MQFANQKNSNIHRRVGLHELEKLLQVAAPTQKKTVLQNTDSSMQQWFALFLKLRAQQNQPKVYKPKYFCGLGLVLEWCEKKRVHLLQMRLGTLRDFVVDSKQTQAVLNSSLHISKI